MVVLVLINIDLPTYKITIHTNCLCDHIPSEVRRGKGTSGKSSIENLDRTGGWFGRLLLKTDLVMIKDLMCRDGTPPDLSTVTAQNKCSEVYKNAFRTIEAINPRIAGFKVTVCCC